MVQGEARGIVDGKTIRIMRNNAARNEVRNENNGPSCILPSSTSIPFVVSSLIDLMIVVSLNNFLLLIGLQRVSGKPREFAKKKQSPNVPDYAFFFCPIPKTMVMGLHISDQRMGRYLFYLYLEPALEPLLVVPQGRGGFSGLE